MQIQIVFDTKRGSTKKIVHWMEEELVAAGHSISLSKPDEVSHIQADLIILGSPIYLETPLSSMKTFVAEHADELKNHKCAVFIVGWAKKVYEKVRRRIEHNYYGPLVGALGEAVCSRHMFTGWIGKKIDDAQEEEAKEWVRSILAAE